MSGAPLPDLPRFKGRGRIAPADASPSPPPPRRPWGPSLRRLGIAGLVVGLLGLAWSLRTRLGRAAPLLAQKLEVELTGLFDAFGKLVAGIKSPAPTPPPGTPAPTAPAGRGGTAAAGSAPDPGGLRVAGPTGAVLTVGDLLADLRPGSRYRIEGDRLELFEGGALLRFPRNRARLGLRGGFELAGGPALAEVRIDPDSAGTVDVLGDPLGLTAPGGARTEVAPLERCYFPSPDSETYPGAEAETFLKRSAWLAAGKAGNPRMVAQDLARRSLASARGTEREALAERLLTLATGWTAAGPPRAPEAF